MKFIYTAIWLICLVQHYNVDAQTSNEFVQIGVNNGLSQNSVHDIFQDRKGFLWIATADGLNRYDGIRFKVYKHRYADTSKNNIPSDYIQGGMQEDQEDNLWFIAGQDIVMFNKKVNRFHVVYHVNGNPQFNFAENQGKMVLIGEHIWVIGSGNSVLKIHTRNQQVQLVKLPQGVQSVLVDNATSRIFVEKSIGCYELDLINMQLTPTGITDSVQSITVIDDHSFAYINNNQIKIYSKKSNNTRTIDVSNIPMISLDALMVNITSWNKKLLFAMVSGKGLLRYHLETGKIDFYSSIPGDPGSLSINYIRKVFIDRSDNLWLGTEGGGLSKMDLKNRKFNSYPQGVFNMQNPANLMIKSIYARDNKIYAGTFAKGLYIIDTVTLEARVVENRRFNKSANLSPVTVLYNDSKNRLWMNVGNAIGYTNTVTNELQNFDTLNFSGDNVYSIHEVAPDTMMIGCLKRVYRIVVLPNGKVKLDADEVYRHNSINGLIQSITPNGKGEWYIGSVENGFRKCRIMGDKLVVTDSGMLRTGVRHFYPDHKNGLVWIASDNGLVAYNERTRKQVLFNEDDGLSNSHVYAILPEDDNILWISTNKGLNRIVFGKNKNEEPTIHSIQAYTQKNGLQSNEFNSGAWFAYNRQHMIFGGVTGINWFNTGNIVSNHYKPKVTLTGFLANEQTVQGDTAIQYLTNVELPYHQNSLSVTFAALEFTNPAVNQYAYRMMGADDSWVEGSNEIRYAGLRPGTYRLMVKAANNDGVWSEPQLLLRINILPPYWQTWWFKILVAIFLLSLTVLGVRYIIRKRVKDKMRALELQQVLNEERLRISRDMHDEMGTGLTKISLLSEVARQTGSGASTDKVTGVLQDITGTSRGLTQKMGEIIWMLNPVNDTLDSLAAYLKEFVFATTDSLELAVVTDFPDYIPALKLSHEKRRQLLLVTREALHNALKHSKATQLTFSLEVHSKGFQFFINDDGVGFQLGEKEPLNGKHNGLKNMQWRMEQINGFFTVESEPGKGTTIIYGMEL